MLHLSNIRPDQIEQDVRRARIPRNVDSTSHRAALIIEILMGVVEAVVGCGLDLASSCRVSLHSEGYSLHSACGLCSPSMRLWEEYALPSRGGRIKDQDPTLNPSLLRQDFLHPANLTRFKANLNPVWMRWRTCQNVFNDSSCKDAATLVLLLYNLYL